MTTEKKDYSALVEQLLPAIIGAESRGNPNAVGPETQHGRAKGLAQFTDATWAEWGNGKNVFDPQANEDAARRYATYLAKRFNGDPEKIVAAWNWGMGNVERQGLGRAPAETRAYIPEVMQRAGLGGSQIALAGMENSKNPVYAQVAPTPAPESGSEMRASTALTDAMDAEDATTAPETAPTRGLDPQELLAQLAPAAEAPRTTDFMAKMQELTQRSREKPPVEELAAAIPQGTSLIQQMRDRAFAPQPTVAQLFEYLKQQHMRV